MLLAGDSGPSNYAQASSLADGVLPYDLGSINRECWLTDRQLLTLICHRLPLPESR